MDRLDVRFAESAIRRGLLSFERIRGCIDEVQDGKTLRDLVLERGLITQSQHSELLKLLENQEDITPTAMDDNRFCEAVVARGLLDVDRLLEAVRRREESKNGELALPPLDDMLVELGYLTKAQVERLRGKDAPPKLDIPDQAHPKLGEIAVKNGFITDEQLKHCLFLQMEQKQDGREQKLGEILLSRGYISPEQLQEVLNEHAAETKALMIPGYQLLARIGAGGMGEIYKARQLSVDRIVAIKVLPRQFAKEKEYASRFVREAKLLAKLNHPNIVTMIDAGHINNTYYYVMEFVDGVTVDDLLEKHGRLAERECMRIGMAVAAALDHAAKNKLVHRDIKPSNIMLTRDGTIKLCDLGIAKLLDAGPGERTGTMETLVAGTPDYISPEACTGAKVDARSDIYSLGATLFHCATGRPPFRAPTADALMLMRLHVDPIHPQELIPSLSKRFSDAIIKMIRREAEQRFQTAGELHKALETIMTGASETDNSSTAIRSTIKVPALPVNPKLSWGPIIAAILATLLVFAGVTAYLFRDTGYFKLPFLK